MIDWVLEASLYPAICAPTRARSPARSRPKVCPGFGFDRSKQPLTSLIDINLNPVNTRAVTFEEYDERLTTG